MYVKCPSKLNKLQISYSEIVHDIDVVKGLTDQYHKEGAASTAINPFKFHNRCCVTKPIYQQVNI